MTYLFGIVPVLLIAAAISLALAMWYRRVVSTNMVHIVQRRRVTMPYGTGQDAGNVYYAWPSWLPFIGIMVIELPVSNFELALVDYEAYDKDRVPFLIDVVAFFRVKDTATAAQRVASIDEMKEQLSRIVQGAVRKVLASDVIDKIMTERAQFGQAFTAEVQEQLDEWGVESVKSMELMDIRDTPSGKAVANIMAKKVSHIEMESRKEVAKNHQEAETAEIEARQAVDVRAQEAAQMVGQRTAEKDKQVGIAGKQAEQAVFEAEKATKEASMEVQRVQQVKQAEITRDQQVVVAEQDKQTQVIRADGALEAAKLEAEGVRVKGEADGKAQEAVLMAPVNAQISLAKEIGENKGYQGYLIQVEAIKAYIEVGGKQAAALEKAEVKIIANSGNPTDGMKSVMDLFTSKGGTQLGGMVEAFAQTPVGAALLTQVGTSPSEKSEGTRPVNNSGNGVAH